MSRLFFWLVVLGYLVNLAGCSTQNPHLMDGVCKTGIESDCAMRSFDQPRIGVTS